MNEDHEKKVINLKQKIECLGGEIIDTKKTTAGTLIQYKLLKRDLFYREITVFYSGGAAPGKFGVIINQTSIEKQ